MKTRLPIIIFCFWALTISGKSQSDIDAAQIYRETFFTGFNELDSVYSLGLLVRDIERTIAQSKIGKTEYGIAIHSLNNDKPYFSYNLTKPLTPASVTKLFTSFAALNLFEADYKIPTKVFTDGYISIDSILKGNLYLVGFGDGTFSLRDLEQLSDNVKEMGVKVIHGNIYVDGSYFDGIYERLTYSGDKDVVVQLPPISAISLDRNVVQAIVSSGSKAGTPLRVQYMPSSEHFSTINSATVRGGKKRASKLRVITKAGQDGKQMFTISGNLAANRTSSFGHNLTFPEMAIAGAFKSRLEAGGIKITGSSSATDAYHKDTSIIFTAVTEFRRPIFDILNKVNKDSDNYLAETLFKIVGAQADLDDDNGKSARLFYNQLFDKYEINCENCMLNDGSGLSRRNLVTPESIIRILQESYNSSFREEFRNSFSSAGNDGTLKKRLKSANGNSNITAKTGTLRNVSALAGYIDTVEGDTIAFAFIFNGPNVGIYKDLENKLAQLLADFTYRFSVTDSYE
ncbi:MAG: D-alanyl-D-alanine carboxypeptidase/D-alanyl-D-alanine-endopeptidase [Ignavibacteriae bacterium HGW-Ignavibacteriae-1]|jgi:D-alanyl-D-alanine carboxypeptidase/D-alanyl-D-alanine-endopeptidase (penicillin-binding protein 4)|nr:MAG: D-alanyl-D-alanine carboxypeptidase/D-alanyl-D-alanine-endopeptidase [Ignavibacteriae bacterium HGW-Ignavibacteriae-1]